MGFGRKRCSAEAQRPRRAPSCAPWMPFRAAIPPTPTGPSRACAQAPRARDTGRSSDLPPPCDGGGRPRLPSRGSRNSSRAPRLWPRRDAPPLHGAGRARRFRRGWVQAPGDLPVGAAGSGLHTLAATNVVRRSGDVGEFGSCRRARRGAALATRADETSARPFGRRRGNRFEAVPHADHDAARPCGAGGECRVHASAPSGHPAASAAVVSPKARVAPPRGKPNQPGRRDIRAGGRILIRRSGHRWSISRACFRCNR